MNRYHRFLDALGKSGQEERMDPSLNLNELVSMFSYNGSGYPISLNQTMVGNKESTPTTFIGYTQQAYHGNGIVFAVQLARLMLFSEARFQFQRLTNGRPGKLFGTNDLAVLEHPWSGATTGDLLARAIQDADLAGNFYGNLRNGQIKRMRPDWVTILLGSNTASAQNQPLPGDLDAEIIAYLYQPGGQGGGQPIETILPEDVVHFAPIPDPLATYRGMSWLTPIVREVMGDSAATSHKLQFFENGATINLAVSMDKDKTIDQYKQFVEVFKHEHQGVANAYKTLMLGPGATPIPIGTNFQQMDFKVVQGAGETRIAAAGGVPPIVVGLSEGLEAATYSNYGQAMRRFADLTMRPLWRNFAGSLERIINVPGGARLWYDSRDIAALKEDGADAANILLVKAQAISALVLAGMAPQSVIDAVEADDLSQLQHTGLTSVQLHPPADPNDPEADPNEAEPDNDPDDAPAASPASNGKGKQASARILSPWLPGVPREEED